MSEYRQYVHLNISVEGNSLLKLIEQSGGADCVVHYISSAVNDALRDWTAGRPPAKRKYAIGPEIYVGIMDQHREKLEYPSIVAKIGTESSCSVFVRSRNIEVGSVIDVMKNDQWRNCIVDDIQDGLYFLSLR